MSKITDDAHGLNYYTGEPMEADALICVDCGERCVGDGAPGDSVPCGGDHDGGERERESHACADCGEYVCGSCTLAGGLCGACFRAQEDKS